MVRAFADFESVRVLMRFVVSVSARVSEKGCACALFHLLWVFGSGFCLLHVGFSPVSV